MVEAKVSLFRFPRPALALHISPEYKKHQFVFHSHGNKNILLKKIQSTSLPGLPLSFNERCLKQRSYLRDTDGYIYGTYMIPRTYF